ncbi:uncharacterized protein LOC132305579 [Cornus florida]|uniref:uncharacterized protein LOC132305579 n=1 Tax=Cornus florida TaxID=4283 RepID=UPI00289CF645|nr:uncharacterized protein LOC132305579 [Cornus florida]
MHLQVIPSDPIPNADHEFAVLGTAAPDCILCSEEIREGMVHLISGGHFLHDGCFNELFNDPLVPQACPQNCKPVFEEDRVRLIHLDVQSDDDDGLFEHSDDASDVADDAAMDDAAADDDAAMDDAGGDGNDAAR